MIWILIRSFIFIITISVCKCYNTLYFNSYIDQIHVDDIITNRQNKHIFIDNEYIKIEFISNISTFIINDRIRLNWNYENEWDSITNIYYDPLIINSIPINNSYDDNNNDTQRRLIEYDYTSWNKYDHTTEHHMTSGRFIGESKYKRKFRDAEAMCHEFYADLASIRNQYENARVEELCKKLGAGSCWIGLEMDKKNKNWAATKNWLDGHPLGYKNWAPGEPNNVRGREKCAEIYNTGMWNDLPCNRKRYAICEKVESHHMGRFIGVYKLASWYKGNLYCKMKYGTELGSITSTWKQDDALTACNSVKNEFKKEDCWIGLEKKHNVLWEWVDKSLMQFKNWGEQEPKPTPSKKCAYINAHTQSGVWANDFCDAQKWIICNAEETTPTLMTKDMLFPPSYKEIHERNSLMKYLEQAEAQQKKNEEALVKLEQHRTERKHTITEDKSELRQETRDENKNKPQPPPFQHLPLMQKEQESSISEYQSPQYQSPQYQSPQYQSPQYQSSQSHTKLQMPSHGEDKDELRDETKEENKFSWKPQIPPFGQVLPQSPNTAPQSPNYVAPPSPNTANVDQQISQVHQRIDQIEKKLNSLHGKDSGSPSIGGDNNKPMGMLNNLINGLMSQSGQGNMNNMVKQNAFDHSFNTQGYNPGKDPYFGDYNMKYAHHQKLKQHLAAIHATNQDNHDPYSPPSGNADDPYGFNGVSQYNPQFYPQTQIPGPHAGARRLYHHDDDADIIISKQTEKCKSIDIYHTLCIKYDYQRNEMIFDIMIGNEGDSNNTNINIVQYYEEIDIMFEFNPYTEFHKLCKIINGLNICLVRDSKTKSITIFINDEIVNEWNKVYSNINKKCINSSLNKICVMPIVDFSDYLVEIKMKE